MSINPTTAFIGKIAPASGNYPYGQAQDITVPGDGSGTPWNALLLNDVFGFQQALLTGAGIVPSGTPDNAIESQYLTAAKLIMGAVVSSFTVLRAIDSSEIADGTRIFVTDDLSGGNFVVKAGTVTDNNGILLVFTDDSNRYAERQFSGPIVVGWFEIIDDDVTDITDDLNDVLALGGHIYFGKGAGSYMISDELHPVANSILEFDSGVGIDILDAGDAINTTGFGVFDIDDVDNVKIIGNGLTITGIRTGTGIDNVNFGVKVAGATNVLLEDIYTVNMAGDGFYFAGSTDNGSVKFCDTVWVYRCKSTTAMRTGTAVVSAQNLWMIDCVNIGTNGKDTESGIDIETDGVDGIMKNINIINMFCSDNKMADFSLVLGGNATPSTVDADVKLINCVARDSTTYVETIAFRILNHKTTYADNGNVQLIDCTAQNINNMGLYIRNIDKSSTPVYIENMTLIDTALTAASNIKDPGTGSVIGDSPFNMGNNNAIYPNPGGVHINGLKIRDNTRDRGPYYIQAAQGNPWVDVSIKGLDWKNSVGETTIPFIQNASDIIVEKTADPFQLDRTANITLSTKFSRWRMTNSGAAGLVVFELPPITSSFSTTEFEFVVMASQLLRIEPNASDEIHNFGNGDGKYVEANSVGVRITIKFFDADGWIMEVNDESAITAEV